MHPSHISRRMDAFEGKLAQLRSLAPLTEAQIAGDWLLAAAIERHLWSLVQGMLDTCQSLAGRQSRSHAPSGGDLIRRCVQLGVLTENERYYQVVRLQTMLVDHDRGPDTGMLAAMVNEHLDDFARFAAEVRAYLGRSPAGPS
jgi:uncharacterized protein YutE (UPF0331/DUF86 family)